ncbi:MAG TPA: hypothetical protein DE042_04425 [Colwellia sp.]|nr:hypothetical protein [Colwellia sp.]
MDNWIAYAMITIAFVIIVGNFSTFQKNTNQRMRKKNLNDLEETLPRNNKTDNKMPTLDKNKLK